MVGPDRAWETSQVLAQPGPWASRISAHRQLSTSRRPRPRAQGGLPKRQPGPV